MRHLSIFSSEPLAANEVNLNAESAHLITVPYRGLETSKIGRGLIF